MGSALFSWPPHRSSIAPVPWRHQAPSQRAHPVSRSFVTLDGDAALLPHNPLTSSKPPMIRTRSRNGPDWNSAIASQTDKNRGFQARFCSGTGVAFPPFVTGLVRFVALWLVWLRRLATPIALSIPFLVEGCAHSAEAPKAHGRPEAVVIDFF